MIFFLTSLRAFGFLRLALNRPHTFSCSMFFCRKLVEPNKFSETKQSHAAYNCWESHWKRQHSCQHTLLNTTDDCTQDTQPSSEGTHTFWLPKIAFILRINNNKYYYYNSKVINCYFWMHSFDYTHTEAMPTEKFYTPNIPDTFRTIHKTENSFHVLCSICANAIHSQPRPFVRM